MSWVDGRDCGSPIADWAASGAMALTGAGKGPPQLAAGTAATAVRRAMAALASVAGAAGLEASPLPDERLLGERAALMGLRRAGTISAGGASRLLAAADGTVAMTLSRPDDLAAVPALLSRDAVHDPWAELAAWCREHRREEVIERATLLGLAAGEVDHSLPAPAPGAMPETASPGPGPGHPPRVVDLSALWAGPLCAHLLGLTGSEVSYVESTRRPDPTRQACPEFHALLRSGCRPVALDLKDPRAVARLRELLLQADIVIESSRPRALAQLGIEADAIVRESGHCTWVSITAYGREHNRIGYGDDVAAAAGLLGAGPVFAGDALADPLTGCHAAVAALRGWRAGGVGVIDVAMYEVARAARGPLPVADVVRRDGEWFVDDGTEVVPVRAPAARQAAR